MASWRLSVGGGRLLVVGRMLAITCGGLLVAGIPLLVGGCWLGVVGGRDCRRGGSRAARMGVPRSGPESCHGHPEQNHRGRSWLCSGTGKMAVARCSCGFTPPLHGHAMACPRPCHGRPGHARAPRCFGVARFFGARERVPPLMPGIVSADIRCGGVSGDQRGGRKAAGSRRLAVGGSPVVGRQ